MSRMVKMVVSIAVAGTASCTAGRYKVTHDFPAAMAPAIKADYVKQWEKGRVLYGLNCAKCHNTTQGRHEVIPDFAQERLTGYELRVQNRRHESGIPEEIVSAEDLGMITIFLTYKKKSGVAQVH